MRTLLQQLDGDIAECERVVEFSEGELKKAVKLGSYKEAAMRQELIARHTAMAKRLRDYREAYMREHGDSPAFCRWTYSAYTGCYHTSCGKTAFDLDGRLALGKFCCFCGAKHGDDPDYFPI